MLALYRGGRQAEALASYQAFRRVLAEELGIEPTAALKELERRMLRQDADLEPGQPPEAPRPVAKSAPRAGADLALLERDDALATLVGAYESAARGEGRIVFVTGEPGIGKTSLVTRFARDLGEGRVCSSAPATTSRLPGRSARSATSSEPSHRHSKRPSHPAPRRTSSTTC